MGSAVLSDRFGWNGSIALLIDLSNLLPRRNLHELERSGSEWERQYSIDYSELIPGQAFTRLGEAVLHLFGKKEGEKEKKTVTQ